PHRKKDHIFQRIKFKCEGQQFLGKVLSPPVGADLDSDLIDIFYPLPPLISRGNRDLTDDFACLSMCHRQLTIWTFSNVQQQCLLSLSSACKCREATICPQAFNKRGGTKIAQQERPTGSLQHFRARRYI